MALSESALDELAAEYRRIVAEAEKLMVEAEGIRAFLGRYNRPTAEVVGHHDRLSGKVRVEPEGEPSGIRSMIVKILTTADRGYRPAEMKDALIARGFKDAEDVATPLGVRVGSELARLYRDGKIAKAPDGRYVRKKGSSIQLPIGTEAGKA